LKHALAQQCHKISLHTILIGVMGTIYKCHTEVPLSKLGLTGVEKENLLSIKILILFNMQQRS